MDLGTAKKLIQRYIQGHTEFSRHADIADRYYHIQNDILLGPPKHTQMNCACPQADGIADPLRQADNRIPHSFYNLLVDQKVAYMFTAPPLFDVKDDRQNQMITKTLGDGYAKKAKELAVNASNAGIAWLHYWQDGGGFGWGVVPSTEIIPVWSHKLDHSLLAVLRVYRDVDEETGDTYDVYEYWNDTQCQAFRKLVAADITIETGLQPWQRFTDYDSGEAGTPTNEFTHKLGAVPFIPFYNNGMGTGDLDKVKALIDAYDKTYSGFMNDLEDVQEVIFVLNNYGGQDLNEFLKDLKYYKAIQTESGGSGDKSGVSTLTVDIPVEAREKMLEITRKAIFDMGQGIDPQQQGLDATSGEAMKFLYALLELKAGLMETEFRLGFNQFIRAILRVAGEKEPATITQTWTRTSIRNDAELVDMCSKSEGIVSRKTILKNHPFVENVEDEEKQLDKEEADAAAKNDIYNNDSAVKGGDDNV